MNSKGQVLVLFILLIPCLLVCMAFVIDIGNLYRENKHLESSIKDGLYYGLNNANLVNVKEKTEELIRKNVDDIEEIKIQKNEDYLQIYVRKDYKGLFSFLFQNNIYKIESTYYGYKTDGKIIINKE